MNVRFVARFPCSNLGEVRGDAVGDARRVRARRSVKIDEVKEEIISGRCIVWCLKVEWWDLIRFWTFFLTLEGEKC